MNKPYCYCGSKDKDHFMILCTECRNYFHPSCFKEGLPSSLTGDIFFYFTCANCAPKEECIRMKLQWTQVIVLTLYNLQLQCNGKKGYYRWKEDICSMIDKNWKLFFGPNKNKTATWHGTVAGTLSGGSPAHFKSGTQELNEIGWWALADPKKFCIVDIEGLVNQFKFNEPRRESPRFKSKSATLRSRTTKPTIQAACDLKEKRSNFTQNKRAKRSAPSSTATSTSSLSEETKDSSWLMTKIKKEPPDNVSISDSSTFDWDHRDESTDSWFTERDLKPDATLPQLLLKDDEENLEDIEIDSGSGSPIPLTHSPQMEDLLSVVDEFVTPIPKVEPSETKSTDSVSDSDTANDISEVRPTRKRKNNQENEEKPQPITICQPLSIYEEKILLKQLECMPEALTQSVQARVLRRKLLLRKEQREWNLPVFDIDSLLIKSGRVKTLLTEKQKNLFMGQNPSISVSYSGDYRVLDRYHLKGFKVKTQSNKRPLFLTRLIGRDESYLDGIVSPYTARVLKPFIWRDYETVPPKLKLLEEIIAYTQRKINSKWVAPPRAPIDYSYVRPDHIPCINALCQEFYWPGIDLSECLQYPDFSCVALYKWMIIGFAFMVPDVKWNEAYISFVFTHPDWRRAGIATFMIYHLLQTCMGKDVTLHVSVTNPALLLYQKFGFKLEEFVVDFYDKYYADDCRECKHAFFLKLPH